MGPETAAFLATAEEVLARSGSLDLPSLNESNTKRLLIEPMLAALGWNLFNVGSVFSEYRVYDGTFLDYALIVDAKAVLFCEAKPTGKRLTDPKWVSQTINYANNEGVVWCVLTDGLHWRVYKANEPVAMDRKLAFEVDLADLLDGVRRDRALGLFRCLTPAGASDGQLTALGTQVFVDGRVREALIAVLEQPDKKLIDLLRTRLGAEGRLSPADIKAAMSRVAAPALTVLNKASAAGPAEPTRTQVPAVVPPRPVIQRLAPGRVDRSGSPAAGAIAGGPRSVGALVRAGLLVTGEKLYLSHRDVVHEATLLADGRVRVSSVDEPFTSLSTAATVVTGGGSWNGWKHWYVERPAGRVYLHSLRSRLAVAD